MVRAIRMHQTGGPEVLRYEEIALADPGPGEIRVRLGAIGLNFSEINNRHGRWGFKPAEFPYIPGLEGAGTVAKVGAGVTDLRIGQRVCFAAGGARQSYAEEVNIKADAAIPTPDSVSDDAAAAMMLKGLTAHMLLRSVFPARKGQTALVTGAAGGVGAILCAWASHIGVRVIGAVGGIEKAAFARAHGCDATVDTSSGGLADAVLELTQGKGVDVVYDAVGRELIDASLKSLGKRGMLVTYGQTSGPAPACDPAALMKGSLYFTRPMLHDYITGKEERLAAARELFELVSGAQIRIEVTRTYPLEKAADVHREREARDGIASWIMKP
jgi:NADPH2:quinone reductase